MRLWGAGKEGPEMELTPITDEQLAASLKEAAEHTAYLAGELVKRRWTVSVNIYPYTSDKGPTANISVYRNQVLAGAP